MSKTLHITISTPTRILATSDNVVAVRTEDQSGTFGVLLCHADLLTSLIPSVVRWRTADGAECFCAVSGGVLTVSAGRDVAIACREGVVGSSLQELETKVRAARARHSELDRKARVEQTRLHARAVRQLVRYLRPNAAAAAAAEREAVS